MCKYLKIRRPRNKYEEQWDKYNNYSHKRKRTHKETAKRTRSLLYLLEKILRLLNEIENRNQEQLELSKAYYQKNKSIRKVLKQPQEIFDTGKTRPEFKHLKVIHQANCLWQCSKGARVRSQS